MLDLAWVFCISKHKSELDSIPLYHPCSQLGSTTAFWRQTLIRSRNTVYSLVLEPTDTLSHPTVILAEVSTDGDLTTL